MNRLRFLTGLLVALCLLNAPTWAQQNSDGRLPVLQMQEPFLLLIRDPLVQAELDLSAGQAEQLKLLTDATDGPLLTTRNQSPDRGKEITKALIEQTRQRLSQFLNADQLKRLDQIELWVLGLRSLERPEVIAALGMSPAVQQSIQTELQSYQAEFHKLREQAMAGEPLAPLEKKNADLLKSTQQRIQKILTPAQQRQWGELLGSPLKTENFGHVEFQAPEFLGSGPWVNSPPLDWRDLRGKVVAVHFWTFGCINCIHNYPAYHHWMNKFSGRDFVMLGIHTPEVDREHDVVMLRQKAREHNLTFPILVDNDKQNWNAWGNSMWPTVYLIDKQGDIRYWWQGELNWQQQEGEKLFTQRIEELLSE